MSNRPMQDFFTLFFEMRCHKRFDTGGIETEIDIAFVRCLSASERAEQAQFRETVLAGKPFLVFPKDVKYFLARGGHFFFSFRIAPDFTINFGVKQNRLSCNRQRNAVRCCRFDQPREIPMSQENADGKTPQKQTQGAWFRFWRIAAIVFVIHLIPVIYILGVCIASSEGVMGWLLFLMIDFPLGWLFLPAMALLDLCTPLEVWFEVKNIVFPAVFFQIVGTINWVIIVLFLRWLARLLFGRCFRAI